LAALLRCFADWLLLNPAFGFSARASRQYLHQQYAVRKHRPPRNTGGTSAT